jgi:voltage-gated potassium channel
VENPRYHRPILGRLRYMLSPLAIIDLLAIVPFYLRVWLTVGRFDLRALRTVRLLWLFRIVKLTRYSRALNLIGRVIKDRRAELAVAVSAMVIVMVLSSVLLYYVEQPAQPEAFGTIPDAMWWAVMTLTTVGYGDVVPVTPIGRFLGGLVAMLGIAMFALPTSILGAGLVEHHKKTIRHCPHCGEKLP